jgi:hypothetical protein
VLMSAKLALKVLAIVHLVTQHWIEFYLEIIAFVHQATALPIHHSSAFKIAAIRILFVLSAWILPPLK